MFGKNKYKLKKQPSTPRHLKRTQKMNASHIQCKPQRILVAKTISTYHHNAA